MVESAENVDYEAGSVICTAGNAADAVFVILEGIVTENGIEIPRGHVLCLSALLQAKTVYPSTLKAKTPVKLSKIHHKTAIKIIYEN